MSRTNKQAHLAQYKTRKTRRNIYLYWTVVFVYMYFFLVFLLETFSNRLGTVNVFLFFSIQYTSDGRV